MAGEDDRIRGSILRGEGYEVEAVLKGLGDKREGLAELFAGHIREASGK